MWPHLTPFRILVSLLTLNWRWRTTQMVLLAAASTSFGSCAQFANQCQLTPCTPSSMPSSQVDCCNAVLYIRSHWRRHSATTGSASRCSATNHSVRRNDHITPTLHDTLHWLPVSQRKIALMTTTVSVADHQCTSATSVRSSLFPFVLSFALLTTMTWLYHVLGPRITVHAVSASRHPRFGTCYHLISKQ